VIEVTARDSDLERSSDFVGGESSVGRKEAANLHRARHVRTRLTGMSFGSSYFTLLRATMIGLSAQTPLARKSCDCDSSMRIRRNQAFP
jgi:hypothetical protein